MHKIGKWRNEFYVDQMKISREIFMKAALSETQDREVSVTFSSGEREPCVIPGYFLPATGQQQFPHGMWEKISTLKKQNGKSGDFAKFTRVSHLSPFIIRFAYLPTE